MPRSLPTLAVGAVAIVVIAVLAWGLLPLGPQQGVVGPSPTASPKASPTAAPSSTPTPLPRPSAIIDSTTALKVVDNFQRLMNAGRIEEAADLVWVGATISGRATFSRGDVIAALQTTCGATFGGPVGEVIANEVIRGTTLVDRPGYACPSAGYAYGARFTVENALIVDYWPRAQLLRN